MRSIFYNLISNTLKYHSSSRPLLIQLRTYSEEKQVVLEVEDNGRGISEQQKAKLFTHFTRFHSDVEGSGIGLFMIKRMIENHGGSIEVDSQEDQGTKFRVFFSCIMISKLKIQFLHTSDFRLNIHLPCHGGLYMFTQLTYYIGTVKSVRFF